MARGDGQKGFTPAKLRGEDQKGGLNDLMLGGFGRTAVRQSWREQWRVAGFFQAAFDLLPPGLPECEVIRAGAEFKPLLRLFPPIVPSLPPSAHVCFGSPRR